VCSIGNRPIIGGKKTLLEVFLFDFNREVYGLEMDGADFAFNRDVDGWKINGASIF
jgi:FAD synthase